MQEMMGSMKRKNVPVFFSLVTEYCLKLTLNSLTLKLQGLLAAEKLQKRNKSVCKKMH